MHPCQLRVFLFRLFPAQLAASVSVNISVMFWLVWSISSFHFKSTGFALYRRSNTSEARLQLVPTFRRPAPSHTHSAAGRGKNDTCVGSEITMLPSSATQWFFSKCKMGLFVSFNTSILPLPVTAHPPLRLLLILHYL